MAIQKEAFRSYKLEGEKKDDVFTVWLNNAERSQLEEAKLVLQQPKDSTAFKILAEIGYYDLIGDKKTRFIIERIFKNQRLNLKTGAFVDSPISGFSNGKTE